jgi:hypothetical protein
MADLPKYLKKLDESDLLQLRKIISEDMAEKHASYAKNIDKPIESRTLTYFEHKLADFASTADWIIKAIIAKTPTIYKSEELGEIMGALESEENQQILADIHQDFRECISLITTDKGSHLYIKGASQGMIDQGIDGEKDYGVVFVTHTDNTTDLMLVGDILKLQEGDVVAFNPYEETATFSKGQFLKNQSEAP